MTDLLPFEQQDAVDQPGIIGARWWQESIAVPVGRRSALKSFVVVGGALAGLGAILTIGARACSDDDDWRTETRNALAMQKQYGWNFGAADEALTFDGVGTIPYDKAAVANLPYEMRPLRADLVPYYLPTLFQAPEAMPTARPQGDPTPFRPLRDALRPVFTSLVLMAYLQGKAFADLLEAAKGARSAKMAVVVDLAGPQSVAFAAGAATALDPVFVFDNWPHPRGVVPSHLTLGAAAYFQPLFLRTRETRPSDAPPLFVLDRERIHDYTDDATQFDNRYLARLPPASRLRDLGIARLLYVVPRPTDAIERDDLNDDFVAYSLSGIDVKILHAEAFRPADPNADARTLFSTVDVTRGPQADSLPPFMYGGSSVGEQDFWVDYPWGTPVPKDAKGQHPPGASYVPRPRKTTYSSGSANAGTPTRPSNFGLVPVVVAVGTGLILGAGMSRNGSWNRTSGSWGGG